ncbi:MAG UNVERIFIED_CONTAM: hypothetical protein LVR18_40100 [Planctomycetaceae bacterium]
MKNPGSCRGNTGFRRVQPAAPSPTLPARQSGTPPKWSVAGQVLRIAVLVCSAGLAPAAVSFLGQHQFGAAGDDDELLRSGPAQGPWRRPVPGCGGWSKSSRVCSECSTAATAL